MFKLQNWSDCFTGREDLGVQLIQQIRRLMVQDTATDDIERGFVYWVGDVNQRIWVEEGRQPVDFTLWKIHIQTEFLKPKVLKEATPIVELANYAATLGFCALIPDGEKGWLLANTIVAHQDMSPGPLGLANASPEGTGKMTSRLDNA